MAFKEELNYYPDLLQQDNAQPEIMTVESQNFRIVWVGKNVI